MLKKCSIETKECRKNKKIQELRNRDFLINNKKLAKRDRLKKNNNEVQEKTNNKKIDNLVLEEIWMFEIHKGIKKIY